MPITFELPPEISVTIYLNKATSKKCAGGMDGDRAALGTRSSIGSRLG
jgi:hypothetical protein